MARTRRAAARPRAALARALAAAVVLALAGAGTPALAAPAQRPCLSEEVSQILSRRSGEHAFDGLLPEGFRLESLRVGSDRIDVDATDTRGEPRSVVLRMAGDETGAVDGRGRWFTFTIDAHGGSLDAAGRRGLLEIATRVDAAVPESEATRRCGAPHGSKGPGAHDSGSTEVPASHRSRWLSLTVGAAELLAVLGALIFARRTRSASRPNPASGPWWLDGIAFVAAALALHMNGGSSPVLWFDTFNDQRDVRECLARGLCTTVGEATSVPGLYHAVGWLDMLALAARAGIGVGALHLALQILGAIGAAMTCWVTRHAFGFKAGAIATLAFLSFTTRAVNLQALYNTVPLPFLGVALLACGAASAERPGVVGVMLTAIVGGVLASVHAACGLAFVSVVWIALLSPRHKARMALLAAAVFAGTAIAVGPSAWAECGRAALEALAGHRARTGGTGAGLGGAAPYAAALALAVTARQMAPPARRRLIDVALAITTPMLLASFAAAWTSAVPTNTKYLAHVAAPAALLVGSAVMATLDATARFAFVGSERASRVVAALGLVVILAQIPMGRLLGLRDEALTFREGAAIVRELGDRGWTLPQVRRGLRSPDLAVLLESFPMLAPDFPEGPAPDDPTIVYVGHVNVTDVPRPLPEGWTVAATDGDSALVLAFTRSILSWDRFTVCDGGRAPADRCVPAALDLPTDPASPCRSCVPFMPPVQRPGKRTFELRFGVRAGTGGARAIVMPSRPLLCSGEIASLPGERPETGSDRRRGTWIDAAGAGPSEEVTLRWTIGSEACEMNAYMGVPPFFLEGDAKTVAELERLRF